MQSILGELLEKFEPVFGATDFSKPDAGKTFNTTSVGVQGES